ALASRTSSEMRITLGAYALSSNSHDALTRLRRSAASLQATDRKEVTGEYWKEMDCHNRRRRLDTGRRARRLRPQLRSGERGDRLDDIDDDNAVVRAERH